jgi:hypothetical protein
MDGSRFDTWTRRGLGAPAGGFVAALFGLGVLDNANAKKKRRKKKRRKKACPSSTKACGGAWIPQASCCANAECGSGAACIDGACVCLSGFAECNDDCIPEDDCCTDDDCPASAPCQEGVCVCPRAGDVACGDDCVNLAGNTLHCGACDAACASGQVCVHGACTCVGIDDCPFAGCVCGARKQGGAACFGPGGAGTCTTDDDCPVGSFCSVSGFCLGQCLP